MPDSTDDEKAKKILAEINDFGINGNSKLYNHTLIENIIRLKEIIEESSKIENISAEKKLSLKDKIHTLKSSLLEKLYAKINEPIESEKNNDNLLNCCKELYPIVSEDEQVAIAKKIGKLIEKQPEFKETIAKKIEKLIEKQPEIQEILQEKNNNSNSNSSITATPLKDKKIASTVTLQQNLPPKVTVTSEDDPEPKIEAPDDDKPKNETPSNDDEKANKILEEINDFGINGNSKLYNHTLIENIIRLKEIIEESSKIENISAENKVSLEDKIHILKSSLLEKLYAKINEPIESEKNNDNLLNCCKELYPIVSEDEQVAIAKKIGKLIEKQPEFKETIAKKIEKLIEKQPEIQEILQEKNNNSNSNSSITATPLKDKKIASTVTLQQNLPPKVTVTSEDDPEPKIEAPDDDKPKNETPSNDDEKANKILEEINDFGINGNSKLYNHTLIENIIRLKEIIEESSKIENISAENKVSLEDKIHILKSSLLEKLYAKINEPIESEKNNDNLLNCCKELYPIVSEDEQVAIAKKIGKLIEKQPEFKETIAKKIEKLIEKQPEIQEILQEKNNDSNSNSSLTATPLDDKKKLEEQQNIKDKKIASGTVTLQQKPSTPKVTVTSEDDPEPKIEAPDDDKPKNETPSKESYIAGLSDWVRIFMAFMYNLKLVQAVKSVYSYFEGRRNKDSDVQDRETPEGFFSRLAKAVSSLYSKWRGATNEETNPAGGLELNLPGNPGDGPAPDGSGNPEGSGTPPGPGNPEGSGTPPGPGNPEGSGTPPGPGNPEGSGTPPGPLAPDGSGNPVDGSDGATNPESEALEQLGGDGSGPSDGADPTKPAGGAKIEVATIPQVPAATNRARKPAQKPIIDNKHGKELEETAKLREPPKQGLEDKFMAKKMSASSKNPTTQPNSPRPSSKVVSDDDGSSKKIDTTKVIKESFPSGVEETYQCIIKPMSDLEGGAEGRPNEKGYIYVELVEGEKGRELEYRLLHNNGENIIGNITPNDKDIGNFKIPAKLDLTDEKFKEKFIIKTQRRIHISTQSQPKHLASRDIHNKQTAAKELNNSAEQELTQETSNPTNNGRRPNKPR